MEGLFQSSESLSKSLEACEPKPSCQKGRFVISVNTYLQTLGSTLVLNQSEKDSIITSLSTLKSRLSSYFGSDISEKKEFGSYSRGTILPRKADCNSDVDLMIVFCNPNDYKPQTFLNRLKTFAEYYYSRSEIYQSSPTIVLELNHIKFELVPAQIRYGSYYIPNGPSDWIYTDVDGLRDSVLKSNNNNNFMIKPVIRLLKHWNIQNNSRKMASFSLEKKIAEDLMYAYFSCSSYTDYVLKALNAIMYFTDTEAVRKAINQVKNAISLENDNYPYLALAEIERVFPEV